MKKLLIILVFIALNSLYAQKKEQPFKFGSISQSDYDLKVYERDSTANAIFLFEFGKTTFYQTRNDIIIKTKYYAKVKIFNKEGIDHATVKIPIYRNSQRSEKVSDIKGITHNGLSKTYLSERNIYRQEVNEQWTEVKFTMPNIKNNTIIEYEYVLESPFKFNFKGWEFQCEIPKLHSEFRALIPGNYVYNRTLRGAQKLSKNDSKIKKKCFSVSGISGEADCEALTYAMNNIPAFIEEDYMTSKDNYLSAIRFELSEFRGFYGGVEKFTKTWKDVDKEFKTEKTIGRQLRKADYIKKQLPIELINGKNDLAKAKKVYTFIQNHFTWNQKYRVFSEVNVKNAYSKKVGNVTEINIALINALNAVGFDAELMLISTRRKGLPTKVHPVMTDFNYTIAKLNIGDKSYLLDATEKLIPFSMLPFRALNYYGRVMNFEKGSYWYDITPVDKNHTRTYLDLKLNEAGDFIGSINTSNTGYRALYQRNEYYSTNSEEEYLNKIEKDNLDLTVVSYKNNNLNEIEKSFSEFYEIEIEADLNEQNLFINPFIINRISENPFKLQERSYPVDFGYKFEDILALQLEIPKGYKVKSLPENLAFKLPNNAGMYQFSINQNGQKISLISRTKFFKPYFTPQEYPYLKEFYNQIINTQKSLITLEKINP